MSVWGTYVTFGIYHRIVRIWRSSSSFNSWGAGAHDGGWSDDTHWEDVQQSVIEPIFHIVRWVLQVVEQSAAAEPASSHSPDQSAGDPGPDRFSEAQRKQIVDELSRAQGGLDAFPSPDEAAIYAHTNIYPIAQKYDIEVGMHIFRSGEGYILGKPTTSFHHGRIDNLGLLQGASSYHTHPDGPMTGFSGSDRSLAEQARSNSYISHNGYLIRYRAGDFYWDYHRRPPARRENYFEAFDSETRQWRPANATIDWSW